MTDISKRDQVLQSWEEALGVMGSLGTTDRHYGRTRPDTELQRRTQLLLQWMVRRPAGGEALAVLQDTIGVNGDGLVALLLQAYRERPGTRMVDMQHVVDLLRAKGHPKVYVEQTGGGCATLYSGSTWRDDSGDLRQDAVFGPGEFLGVDGLWTEPHISPSEMYVGRDDDGVTSQPQLPAGATDEDIAEVIHLQIVASKAMAAVTAKVRQVCENVRGRLRWGARITDDQCEALSGLTPDEAGGDADWQAAVLLYELPELLNTGDLIVSAGCYLRLVEGKREQAFHIPADQVTNARLYVRAFEQMYHMDCPSAR